MRVEDLLRNLENFVAITTKNENRIREVEVKIENTLTWANKVAALLVEFTVSDDEQTLALLKERVREALNHRPPGVVLLQAVQDPVGSPMFEFAKALVEECSNMVHPAHWKTFEFRSLQELSRQAMKNPRGGIFQGELASALITQSEAFRLFLQAGVKEIFDRHAAAYLAVTKPDNSFEEEDGEDQE